VLDVEAMAANRTGSLVTPASAQPSQAWFESQLLQALRSFDPRQPVWLVDLNRQLGSLVLPGALADALEIAPAAEIKCPLSERLQRWREDEPSLNAAPMEIVEAAVAASPALERRLIGRWRRLVRQAPSEVLASLLLDHFDARCAERLASHPRRHRLPPLVTDSLEPESLAAAVRAWMPLRAEEVGVR
jgi:tRNA 2-selenouridine synthase